MWTHVLLCRSYRDVRHCQKVADEHGEIKQQKTELTNSREKAYQNKRRMSLKLFPKKRQVYQSESQETNCSYMTL